jgi:hypothetical protein
MKVTLVKIYIEEDNHDTDIEMFRVHKEVELLIEPKVGHKLILENGEFYVEKLEQNLKKKKIFLYEITEISHYEYWGDRKAFIKQYLVPLLKYGKWKYNKKECEKRFLSQVKQSSWRKSKLEDGDIHIS